jgi:hypothetical protein
MYRYAYEFKWNRVSAYCYNWFAYEDLNGFLLRCTCMLVFPGSHGVHVYCKDQEFKQGV